jgi:hypothetical protein
VTEVKKRRKRFSRFTASELLKDEPDTKVFHINFARFLGGVNGNGISPVVFEMHRMQF